MPEVTMPRLSDTMQEGTISHWLKQAGDEVKRGDILAEVETDKATMEVESYDAGVLERILVQEGETVPIGQPIAVIGSGSGKGAQQQPAQTAPTPQTTSKQVPQEQRGEAPPPEARRGSEHVSENNAQAGQAPSAERAPSAESAQESSVDGKVKASPLARRMAEEHGIDLQQVHGTGPGGRIVRDDIEDYLEQRPQPALAQEKATQQPEEREPEPTAVQQAQAIAQAAATQPSDDEVVNLTPTQKTIARRLQESKQSIPHFYVSNEVDMTDLLALRQTLNATVGENGVKVTVNDLIVKACALALEAFPEVNSSYKDGQFLRHKHINIGIAVDVPNGLVVPVIRDANVKGVRSIAREAKALIEKARAGRLSINDLSGGTFSVSNLGMMDVTDFAAVINPPEAAILAISSSRKTFMPVDGQPVLRDIMPIRLSADHRILYGATVARFLQEVKRLLQNPYTLLG